MDSETEGKLVHKAEMHSRNGCSHPGEVEGMTEEENEMFEKYAIPEDRRLFAEMDFSKYSEETLLDFFAGVKCFDNWAFDIFAKNGKDFLVGGLDSDICKPSYLDYLKKVKFSDVYRMFTFYSTVAQCDYFRVVLKAENAEEARAQHKEEIQ